MYRYSLTTVRNEEEEDPGDIECKIVPFLIKDDRYAS